MGRELGKKKSKSFRIDSAQPEETPKVVAAKTDHVSDGKSSVSLKYYQKPYECFSSWTKDEMKAFSNLVGKVSARTEAQITATTKTCHAHKGKTKTLPIQISPDVKMYELDVGSKARVHGFFFSSVFYLVWLDREHKILKV